MNLFETWRQVTHPLGVSRKVGGESFADKVLALFDGNFVGYYEMDEDSGTDLIDSSPQGNNGTLTGFALANTDTPVGGKAPLIDGANDYATIYSAGLVSDYSGAAGTVITLLKVSSGGWADTSTARIPFQIRDSSGNNYIFFDKVDSAGEFLFRYNAAGTASSVTKSSITDEGWIMVGLTWDAAADEVKAFWNGVQEGETQTSLGTWAGDPVSDYCAIGSYQGTSAVLVWDGWQAHTIILNKAATEAEMLQVAQWAGF